MCGWRGLCVRESLVGGPRSDGFGENMRNPGVSGAVNLVPIHVCLLWFSMNPSFVLISLSVGGKT